MECSHMQLVYITVARSTCHRVWTGAGPKRLHYLRGASRRAKNMVELQRYLSLCRRKHVGRKQAAEGLRSRNRNVLKSS